MLLLGQLAKIQGLKGEFLFHAIMDDPDRLPDIQGLVLAPPELDLQHAEPVAPARQVKLRGFRWHQERPCVALQDVPDRTTAEALKGWALWMPEDQASLEDGETFRHDWIGCQVLVGDQIVGEVIRLDPSPTGYDMVIMRDLRPGRTGQRDIPYIKAWFQLDLPNRKVHLDPPPGLLELDRLKD
ncbi:ribosome maturation factor RimM [Holophaga foetida]|uniref:ribosome maturation factor RimM n=1 Tax=Holophaga foetida TaxID=35839 RepID=UPI00024742EE|nr:16S rRNA processing protein RimM [Holophaga foetida]